MPTLIAEKLASLNPIVLSKMDKCGPVGSKAKSRRPQVKIVLFLLESCKIFYVQIVSCVLLSSDQSPSLAQRAATSGAYEAAMVSSQKQLVG